MVSTRSRTQMGILIDQARCTGCRSCEFACSTAKEGVSWPAKSRIKMVPFDEVDFYLPMVCMQCETPYCAAPCPAGALSKDPVTGVVSLREDRCVGCKMCLLACPFGAIRLRPSGIAAKCDLCGGDPACVAFCGSGALPYGPLDDLGSSRMTIAAEALRKSSQV